MTLKIGITRFWGTNCDADVKKWIIGHAFNRSLVEQVKATYLYSEDRFDIQDYDLVIIPGGFSYGDYLRSGALAAHTGVMKSVHEFAQKGKPVLGICNGFQILCEAGLLPGVLLKNESRRFQDQWVKVCVQNEYPGLTHPIAARLKKNQVLQLPIAHGDGRYYADSETLKKMLDQKQIWLTYENNPNGSVMDIAGITNANHNIFGLMPHPERALVEWMGSADGVNFL